MKVSNNPPTEEASEANAVNGGFSYICDSKDTTFTFKYKDPFK